MTREEAIEEIKRWTPILLNSGQCTEKTSEAQDMAISALKGFEGMTNGEVFQAIFPCDEVHINGLQEGIVHFSMKSNPDSMDCFDLEWWNSPYQKGGE